MTMFRFVRQLALTLCALMVFAVAFAQSPQQGGEYQPIEGQEGKDVIWLPTSQHLVEKMLDMAKLTPRDYLIDLGSGDGRLVITAAKRGARALGIEYNGDMVELSKRNAAREGVSDRARFVKADLFQSDFSKATVLTMFLMPEINLKLRPLILDLKPGTRIVSNTFTMDDWEADQTAHVEDADKCVNYCTALLWIVPAKVEGRWKLGKGVLTLTQRFQMISGTLASGANTVPITSGRLNGDQIEFLAGDAWYTGRVEGNAMQGTLKSDKGSAAWNATRASN